MILLTGGAGFIGSHTAIKLLEQNEKIIIIDNFSNSHPQVLIKIKEISGKNFDFIHGDIGDKLLLREIFKNYGISDVIHFAGLKAVSESVKEPLMYYDVNVCSTVNLLKVMQEYEVKSLVFSSSATVYGNSKKPPFKEDAQCDSTTNPYGASKSFNEKILFDIANSDPEWHVSILRYFNPVGAHPSGLIGENPKNIPNNLMPIIIEAASGKREHLEVFGKDYETPDGSGIRDFIHILDLADGHFRALLNCRNTNGCNVFNLGTGRGYSVLELIKEFEIATGKKVPFKFGMRRQGDVGISFADVEKARNILNWNSKLDLKDMCIDAWRWHCKNPDGFDE